MKNIFIVTLGIVLVAVLLTVGKNANPTHKMTGGMEMEGHEHTMHEMMVTTDKEFLEGMIPHHEEAVATANEVLARGTTPEVQVLAENIVASQQAEISIMKLWYKEITGTDYVDTGLYTPMMHDLSTLSGIALDKQFTEDMVMHHMGAIMMANQLTSFSTNENLLILAQEIIGAQKKEVEMMNGWLATILK
jgi:uncharacterized protein (DUF305 family)